VGLREFLRLVLNVAAAVRLLGDLLDAGLGVLELLPHLVGLLPGRFELGGHVLQALPILGASGRLLLVVHLDHEGRLLLLGLRVGGLRTAGGRRHGVVDQRREVVLVLALHIAQLAQLLLDGREHSQDLVVARERKLVLDDLWFGRDGLGCRGRGRKVLEFLELAGPDLGLLDLGFLELGFLELGFLDLGLMGLGFLFGRRRGGRGLRFVGFVVLLEPIRKWHAGSLNGLSGAHGARGVWFSVVIDTSPDTLKRRPGNSETA